MELFPPLRLGILNGWIPIVVFFGTFTLILSTFPKDTCKRFYGEKVWSKKHYFFTKIAKIFGLIPLWDPFYLLGVQ